MRRVTTLYVDGQRIRVNSLWKTKITHCWWMWQKAIDDAVAQPPMKLR